MKMQSKKYRRYFAILFSLIFLLQGCVSPKTGQLSIPLPKDISYPSALVIKDKYIGVLSMKGKFDPLYKVNGNLGRKQEEYFIFEKNFLLFTSNSLWKLDIKSNRLLCLIPNIQSDYIYDFSISSDKIYFIFKKNKALDLFNEEIFYSLEEQKEIKVPRIDGLTYKQFFETSNKNQFLLVYRNLEKDEKKVVEELYLWDLTKRTLRKIIYPNMEGYNIRKIVPLVNPSRYYVQASYSHQSELTHKYEYKNNGLILDLQTFKTKIIVNLGIDDGDIYINDTNGNRILYYFEDKNLYQYDLETREKEKLMVSKIKPDFYSMDFNESKYLLISFNTSTIFKKNNEEYTVAPEDINHDYYLIKPEKKWIQLSQRFSNYRIRNCKQTKKNKLVLILEDQRVNKYQIVLWDPMTDIVKVLFEVKNKKIQFYGIIDLNDPSSDYEGFTYNEDYVNIFVRGYISKIETHYVLNFNTLEMKEIKKIHDEDFFTWVYSYKNSIWYVKRNYSSGSYKNIVTIYQLDWNDPEKLVPISTSEFMGNSINRLSSDIVYMPISDTAEGYPKGKLRIVNTRTGKELTFPDSKDFQFITWLEDK